MGQTFQAGAALAPPFGLAAAGLKEEANAALKSIGEAT